MFQIILLETRYNYLINVLRMNFYQVYYQLMELRLPYTFPYLFHLGFQPLNSRKLPAVYGITKKQWFLVDSITVLAGILCYWSIKKVTSAKELEVENLKTKISVLTIQINPHFLFNTLNTIAYYIEENPRLSREMIVKLSDLFQKILEASKYEPCSRIINQR